MHIKSLAAIAAAIVVAGCTTTSQVQLLNGDIQEFASNVGCGAPSISSTRVYDSKTRLVKGEAAFAGVDPCNTLLAAGAQVAAAGMLPKGKGITNTVMSGSFSSAAQSSRVSVN